MKYTDNMKDFHSNDFKKHASDALKEIEAQMKPLPFSKRQIEMALNDSIVHIEDDTAIYETHLFLGYAYGLYYFCNDNGSFNENNHEKTWWFPDEIELMEKEKQK